MTDAALPVINAGLGKIAAAEITTFSNPISPEEAYVVSNYPHWKKQQLLKHRWHFATQRRNLTQSGEPLEDDERPNRFAFPVDGLRPVREKRSDWEQRGKFLYTNTETLEVLFIVNVPEPDFDELFFDALACWIAYQSVEYITQSNTKKEAIKQEYEEAIRTARRNNAFVTGSERFSDFRDPDTRYRYITDRWNYYPGGFSSVFPPLDVE